MTDHDIFTATSRPSAGGDGPARFADGNSNELVDLELPRTRRWPFLVIGVLIGIGATLGAVAYLGGSDDAEVIDQVTVDLATAILERRDLVEEIEWGAELGYGEAIEVAAPADGTITATVEVNTLVNRGDVLFSVDETPFVVFFGETPLYRTLTEGDEGPDVKLLETNLVVLGYDPDGTVTVDETFTSSTEDMVQRWQEDLGIEETGSVEPESVLLVEGPISVDEPAPLGQVARSGSAVATISPRLVTDTVVGPASGEITALAEIGTRIRNGTVVYGADGVDVVALTSLDAIGTFLTDPSTETSALENALIEGGYDPDDTIVVDDVVDDATYAAIGRWRTDRGLEITSGPAMTAYVSVTPGLEVSSRLVTNGAVVETSRPILEAATATLSVTVAIGLGDRDSFSVGDAVQVKLSDDSVLAGRVSQVGTNAVSSENGEEPTVDVVVELNEIPEQDIPAGDVTVLVTGEVIEQALVAPTRALVTLAEGGFAVEMVLEDDTTLLVGVEAGTFDEGLVEITSSQLDAGDEVVVPS